MMDIDISKAGATTHLTCGTLEHNGHYAYVQQGLSYDNEKSVAKEIFDALEKHKPDPPGDGWKLVKITIADYKSWPIKKFYRVHVRYSFKKGDGESYEKEIEITPAQVKIVYDIFRAGV